MPRSGAPEKRRDGGPRRRILVVDDERSINRLACEYLRLGGFETVPAYDGESALAALREGGIDLVVLDIRLPGIGGLEVLDALKKDPRTSSIPVILLSASVPPSAAKPEGAAALMSKPFSPKGLADAVRKLLA